MIEKTGKTVEDAIAAALAELGVDRDQVDYRVIEAPSKPLFGLLGGREAKVEVTVKKVTESEVLLDANHPLAGEALTFEIELMEILDGPTERQSCSEDDCGSCGCGCGD